MKKSSLEIILVLGTLILTSLACSLGGVTISGDKATVDVTLTENQLNRIIQNDATINNGDELMTDVSKVEFHDGYIRTFGTMRNSAGDEVEGSMDVTFGVENDFLTVEIIAVDFPGVTLDDPRIVKANREIARGLTESVTESNGEVKFLEADVTDDGLHLKIEAQIQK